MFTFFLTKFKTFYYFYYKLLCNEILIMCMYVSLFVSVCACVCVSENFFAHFVIGILLFQFIKTL